MKRSDEKKISPSKLKLIIQKKKIKNSNIPINPIINNKKLKFIPSVIRHLRSSDLKIDNLMNYKKIKFSINKFKNNKAKKSVEPKNQLIKINDEIKNLSCLLSKEDLNNLKENKIFFFLSYNKITKKIIENYHIDYNYNRELNTINYNKNINLNQNIHIEEINYHMPSNDLKIIDLYQNNDIFKFEKYLLNSDYNEKLLEIENYFEKFSGDLQKIKELQFLKNQILDQILMAKKFPLQLDLLILLIKIRPNLNINDKYKQDIIYKILKLGYSDFYYEIFTFLEIINKENPNINHFKAKKLEFICEINKKSIEIKLKWIIISENIVTLILEDNQIFDISFSNILKIKNYYKNLFFFIEISLIFPLIYQNLSISWFKVQLEIYQYDLISKLNIASFGKLQTRKLTNPFIKKYIELLFNRISSNQSNSITELTQRLNWRHIIKKKIEETSYSKIKMSDLEKKTALKLLYKPFEISELQKICEKLKKKL